MKFVFKSRHYGILAKVEVSSKEGSSPRWLSGEKYVLTYWQCLLRGGGGSPLNELITHL